MASHLRREPKETGHPEPSNQWSSRSPPFSLEIRADTRLDDWQSQPKTRDRNTNSQSIPEPHLHPFDAAYAPLPNDPDQLHHRARPSRPDPPRGAGRPTLKSSKTTSAARRLPPISTQCRPLGKAFDPERSRPRTLAIGIFNIGNPHSSTHHRYHFVIPSCARNLDQSKHCHPFPSVVLVGRHPEPASLTGQCIILNKVSRADVW